MLYPAKPLSAPTDLSVTATAFPITVGAGGSAGTGSPTYGGTPSGKGSNSVFSTITSTGGGTGLPWSASPPGACMPGGSGGGAAARQLVLQEDLETLLQLVHLKEMMEEILVVLLKMSVVVVEVVP